MYKTSPIYTKVDILNLCGEMKVIVLVAYLFQVFESRF